jgi:hypothetical protein
MEDHKIYKYKLAEYLAAKGHVPQKNGRYHCISPDHGDQDPSMSFYHESVGLNGNYVNCNSCDFAGDIFTVAGALIGKPGTDKEAFKAQ